MCEWVGGGESTLPMMPVPHPSSTDRIVLLTLCCLQDRKGTGVGAEEH